VHTVITRVDRLIHPDPSLRRAERIRLKRLDAMSARLAELHAVQDLLARAADVVGHGWIQDAWFEVTTDDGPRQVTAYDLRSAIEHPVSGACLVGSVVEAAGGPSTVRSQLVQRTLDVLWHALREDPARPVRWCPGPGIRAIQLLELTHWNDAPGRRQEQVVELLHAARTTAGVQRELCRVEHAALARSG
jgi:hypothetical protein